MAEQGDTEELRRAYDETRHRASAAAGRPLEESSTSAGHDLTPSNALDEAFGADWPMQATDKVEEVVQQIRSKTTGPAITISRALVYGLVAGVLALGALILMVIGLVRLINNYLPQGIWLTYLILGAVFLIVGLLFWRKRT